MRYILTLALSICIAFSALAEDKKKIGSLPMKSCSVLLVEEYLSKARLGQKVMVVSDFGDVYSFKSGEVTKVLYIDDEYSVFVRSGGEYFVYNGLKGVGVDEGDRVEKGDFLGELRYNSRYNEHQLEMQVWRDNGRNTYRCSNNEVMCILSGTKYVAPRKVTPAKHKASGRHKKAVAKHSKASRNKRAVASRSKASKKKIAARKTSSKSKKATAAKKKTPAKKPAAKKRRK
jgi:hypothetical protein